MDTCRWTADGTWPCTSHDGEAHNFATPGGPRRLPLAVTAATFPPLLPSGPGQSLDVREILAARGLLNPEG